MEGKLFVLFTGIPGIGKTYISGELEDYLKKNKVETENFDQDKIYEINTRKSLHKVGSKPFKKEVTKMTLEAFRNAFKKRVTVVISSRCNFIPRDRAYYIRMAEKAGYRPVTIDPAEFENPLLKAKLYLVCQQAAHARHNHPTLNYDTKSPDKVAKVVQAFAGEFRYPSPKEGVVASYRLEYLSQKAKEGFNAFDLKDVSESLCKAGFRSNKVLSTGLKEILRKSPEQMFPKELAYNRNPDFLKDIVRFVQEQLNLSKRPIVRIRPNFDIKNIVSVEEPNDLVIKGFRYTHLKKQGKQFFTAKDACKMKYCTNPTHIIYVGYVVEEKDYQQLFKKLKVLLPDLPLQTHFHVTVGYYGRSPPKIVLEKLPETVNMRIRRILMTKDGGLGVADVEIFSQDRQQLDLCGVNGGRNFHLTVGTQGEYVPYHSNQVLKSWFANAQ
jgi:hypothetical protein